LKSVDFPTFGRPTMAMVAVRRDIAALFMEESLRSRAFPCLL